MYPTAKTQDNRAPLYATDEVKIRRHDFCANADPQISRRRNVVRSDESQHDRDVLLRTRRLTLRPFRTEDVAVIETFAGADAYLRFLGEGHPDPTTFVTNNLGKDGAWVIELDNRVVGSIFLDDELACLLDPAVHGRGIASEAAGLVISDGFARRGYREVIARAHPDNVASVRAITRLGFHANEDGTYSLDRSNWQAQQAGSASSS